MRRVAGRKNSMKRDMRPMLTLAVTLAAIMVVGTLATGIVAATATYSVTFTEVGLPAGTSWTATLNGVSLTKTTPSITFTGVAAATSVFWNVSTVPGGTGIQYVPHGTYYGTYYGYMNIPSQKQNVVVFQKQFSVAFLFTPTGSGGVSPSGTAWYDSGTQIQIQAGHYTGYAFSIWKATTGTAVFASATTASTMATITGTGTVTAKFIPTKTKVTFT